MPGALASPQVAVTAIVDSSVERAGQLARDYGVPAKIAARVEDVFSDVDGVVIATPNATHRDIAVSCLNAGIPCLVEKPLATTVADADAMCAAAEKAGKVLAVGYTTRFRDEVLLLHDLLAAHEFGKIYGFHYQEGSVGGWSPVSGYIADKTASGGGVLTVVGTHFLDRMLYWFGYPDRCSLTDDSAGGPEAHCLACFQYTSWGDPFEGTLLLSKTVGLKAGLAIRAERGDIIFPMGRSPLYFQPRSNPSLRTILVPRGPRTFSWDKNDFQLEIENFADACRGKSRPIVDGREGLRSVQLLNALYENRNPLKEAWLDHQGLAG
jgi:predicted dehydrogenase